MSGMTGWQWNGDKFIGDLEDAIAEGVEATLDDVVRAAKFYAPIRTGDLRDSIRWVKTGKYSWSVGSDLRYAIWVEIGTRHMSGRRYLSTAWAQEAHKFRDNIQASLSRRGW